MTQSRGEFPASPRDCGSGDGSCFRESGRISARPHPRPADHQGKDVRRRPGIMICSGKDTKNYLRVFHPWNSAKSEPVNDEEIIRHFGGRGRVHLQFPHTTSAERCRRMMAITHVFGYKPLSTDTLGRGEFPRPYERDDAPDARRRAEQAIARLRAGGPVLLAIEPPPPPPPPPVSPFTPRQSQPRPRRSLEPQPPSPAAPPEPRIPSRPHYPPRPSNPPMPPPPLPQPPSSED